MLPPLLLLPLTGGLLVFLTPSRRSQPHLIKTLAPQVNKTRADERNARSPSMVTMMTVDQNLALSVSLLGMTMVGHWGLPLLRLLSTPGLLYLDFYFIRKAYAEWQAERRIGVAVNDAVLATGLVVTGQFGAGSLFATLFFVSHKLQLQAENNLATYLRPTAATRKEDNALIETLPLQPPRGVPLDKPVWQSWIDRGALPLLSLSAVSTPLLGIKRTLAVLLTNFGYDYRLTAPLSTLSHLKIANERGIWLCDAQVLDRLQQADVLVLDVTWDDKSITALQADIPLPIIALPPLVEEPAKATLITQLQAEGKKVAYFTNSPINRAAPAAADLLIAVELAPVPPVQHMAHVILPDDQPAQLQQIFTLATSLAANQTRGFYLALAPGLLNLGGIYFGHFGVITALLIDYCGAAIGILNSVWPQLQATENQGMGNQGMGNQGMGNQEEVQDGTT